MPDVIIISSPLYDLNIDQNVIGYKIRRGRNHQYIYMVVIAPVFFDRNLSCYIFQGANRPKYTGIYLQPCTLYPDPETLVQLVVEVSSI